MPNAAPMRAMPCLRFSGVVQSAMTAWAVEMVAPAMPAPMRATNSRIRASRPARPLVRQVGGVAEQGVEDDAAGQADEQDGPPADAVGEPAPDRGEEELHGGERRHQQADDDPADPGCGLPPGTTGSM